MALNTIEFEKPIPKLSPEIEEGFSGADKARKKIPIAEGVGKMPKTLDTIPNIPIARQAMARPAYYKELTTNDPGLGELADIAKGDLQKSPLVKVRPEIKKILNRGQKILESNEETNHLHLVVVDGYRSLYIQKKLFEIYRGYLMKEQKISLDEANIEAQKMVSIPPQDPKILQLSPPPHTTGGSIDVVLADTRKFNLNNGQRIQDAMINFGAGFDEMMHPKYGDERSCTRFFEKENISEKDQEAQKNRRLLCNLMTNLGFTNYHSERRHFDKGNQFNAWYNGSSEANYGFASGINNNYIIEDKNDEYNAYERYLEFLQPSRDAIINILEMKKIFGIDNIQGINGGKFSKIKMTA